MSSSHSLDAANELAEKEAEYRDIVNSMLQLSARQRDALNVVITWSYQRGKEWAEFSSIEDFGALCDMGREYTSRVISGLEDAHLLQRIGRRSSLRLRLRPSGLLVEPATRLASRDLGEVLQRTERLNQCPEGYPGGQRLLPLGKTAEERLDDDQAQTSRERGVAMLRETRVKLGRLGERTNEALACQNDEKSQSGERVKIVHKDQNETLAQSGERAKPVLTCQNSTQGTPVSEGDPYTSRAGAQTCKHVPSPLPSMLRHVRGGDEEEEALRGGSENGELKKLSDDELEELLNDEALYFLGELEKICGKGFSNYRKTWMLRLCDRWRGVALDAIGETKHLYLKGTPRKKGWGETANWFFNHYKGKARASS